MVLLLKLEKSRKFNTNNYQRYYGRVKRLFDWEYGNLCKVGHNNLFETYIPHL